MPEYGGARLQLQERLARLLRRVGRIEGDLRSAHDRDSEERAAELENDDVLEGLDAMTLAEVREIRAALTRIDRGQFGICSTCGRPISRERLVVVPTAVTCIACAPTS